MCIPSHSLKTLLIRTIKLSSAFLKKQRLKNSNVLLSRFKASRNTLKFCLLCSDKEIYVIYMPNYNHTGTHANTIVILQLLEWNKITSNM
jgi:hypothetical protein